MVVRLSSYISCSGFEFVVRMKETHHVVLVH
jgi:hypothetical protein